MKKTLPYLIAVLLSLGLCGVVLFIPMADVVLWQHPCLNAYSAFAAAFFVMNTIGLCALARGLDVVGSKPYTKERPIIEKRKSHVTSVVLAFFELPLLATVFFIDGGWKMVICSALFLGGSLILGSIIGEMSANKLRKEFTEIEQRELEEQLRKEEEY